MRGKLYLVATPIGNLGDITIRAIETLRTVNVIAAEDTRHSRYLLSTHSIKTPLISLHEHNEKARSEELLNRLAEGENIALITDAGTPLISDPGHHFVYLAHQQGIQVIPIPGACALIAALSASGLKADCFVFVGFLPSKVTERQKELLSLKAETKTLVFYETPHRILGALNDFATILGEERRMVLAREITKKFETIRSMPIGELRDWVKANNEQQKGEYVLIVEGQTAIKEKTIDDSALQVLSILLEELPLNQAVKLAVKLTGMKKNQLYQQALDLQEK